MTHNNWMSWCRLCAATTSRNNAFSRMDAITDLSALVQKYFFITVTKHYAQYFSYIKMTCPVLPVPHQQSEYDVKPSVICNDCVLFVFNMEKFAVRCSQIDRLFDELIYENLKNPTSEGDISLLRNKYELDDDAGGGGEDNKEEQFQCTQIGVDLAAAVTPIISDAPNQKYIIKQELNDDSLSLFVEVLEEQNTIEPVAAPVITKRKVGRPRKAVAARTYSCCKSEMVSNKKK